MKPPLKEAWQKRLDNVNTETKYADLKSLAKGDYVFVRTNTDGYLGFVVSIGRVNAVISSPYGGWGDSDYTCIQDLKFRRACVAEFYKPR